MVIIYDLFERLIGLVNTLYDLIFYEISIPLPEQLINTILGIEIPERISISLWVVLTGSSILILFGAWIVKKLVPIA